MHAQRWLVCASQMHAECIQLIAGVELLLLHSATHGVKDGRHTLQHLKPDCPQLSELYISNDMHFDDTYAVYNMHLRCTCNGPLAFLPKL